jgi:hypothetical protein
LEELERRLQVLETERELRSVLARYSFTADLGQSQAWVDLFTEDGAYDLGPTGPTAGRFEGPDGLRRVILGPGHKGIEGSCQHWTTGPLVFDIGADCATAEGYSAVLVQRETGIEVWTAGFNRWTFARVDGAWKIVERFRRPIGSPDQQEVFRAREAASPAPSG